LLVICLAGCRTPLAPVPEPFPELTAKPIVIQEDPRAANLLTSLESLRQQRASLQADVKLAVDGPETQLRSNFILGAEQPSQLYIEIISFMQQTLAILITDGHRYEFIRANGKSLKKGRVRSNLLWKAAAIPLPLENTLGVILGVPEWELESPILRASESRSGELTLLVSEPAGGYSQLTFDKTERLVRVTQLDRKKRVRWVARYSDWQTVDGDDFPHELAMDFPETKTQVRISYRDVVLNPAFPEGFFAVGSAN
jgi:outer membrane biogenesis lipoprotein LolB